MNVIIQRCLDMNVDLFIGFIDYLKALDKVKHDRLIEILQHKRLVFNDIKIIKKNVLESEGSNTC